MPLELRVQFYIVIYSLLAGMLTGIFFDVYRILRGLHINKILICIEDLLFWTLCAGIIFTFLLYFNYAFLGVYVYLFIFISLILYFKLVSRKVIKVEKIVIKEVLKIFRITFKNIIYPFKIFFGKIGKKK